MAEEEVMIEDVTDASAVAASIQQKSELSYYHAHSKPREEIPDEIRRGGEGVADGREPQKVDNLPIPKPTEKVHWLEDLAFGDENGKVKLYLDFPESIEGAAITCDFRKYGLTLMVRCPNGGTVYGFYIEPDNYWILEPERSNGFHGEIVPDKCKYRVSSSNMKMSLTLEKADKHDGWHQLRKKVPKFSK